MGRTFFASDHHFGHEGILTFKNYDGTQVRTFDSIEHMNEHMIERHNSVVKPEDKVYFLGDVAMSHRHLHYLGRMNGEKVLIKGNHDTGKLSQYAPYFKDIRGSHQFSGVVMTHIPLHPHCLDRWKLNIHGHLHNNYIKLEDGVTPDTRYYNVSMEVIDFTPVTLEQIKYERGLL